MVRAVRPSSLSSSVTRSAHRVLATRDVFDALAPAVERTGVCLRRVHYLFRDNATVPGDVEVGVARPPCCADVLTCSDRA